MSRAAPRSPSYAHLCALSDFTGVLERARDDAPQPEHGYRVDDVARALIVVLREPDQTPTLAGLTEVYLYFLEDALDGDGHSHNRMDSSGAWSDDYGLGEWWGRAVWALGTAAVRGRTRRIRERAMHAFQVAAAARSPHLHAMVFATLGAAEVLAAHPEDTLARELLADGAAAIPRGSRGKWPWPEPRLRSANAALPEALLAAGRGLHDRSLVTRGLALLDFLLAAETSPEGHLSVAGSDGRGPKDRGPLFGQRPIEVAALADACSRAFELTEDPRWLDGIGLAWGWFTGSNDAGTIMFDVETGAGFDGLEADGRNENRGAESTLAALSTYQAARRHGRVRALATSR